MSQEPRRRWLTFSLKSLFLLVLIVAAYLAGWRSAIETAEREKDAAVRAAVEEIQAAHARQSAADDLLGRYVPELDLVIVTGPEANVDRAKSLLEMPGFFRKNSSGGNRPAVDQSDRDAIRATRSVDRP